jgi:hypothetical protein
LGGHWPRVTIAILSFNRLHYLRATLESARACIEYPNLEWIVSDNESEEPGLRAYIEGCEFVQHKLFKRQTHAAAMNEIVERASGELLLLWPEDMQFVVKGDWLQDLAEILMRHPDVGSLMLDYQRRVTLERLLRPSRRNWRSLLRELVRYRGRIRVARALESSRGTRARTVGHLIQGVCGSGIPSLTRTAVWRRLGPWREAGAAGGLVDSSRGAEDDMVARFFQSRLRLQTALLEVPVAADIITDPTGCKAKVRGRYRYGVYMPPPEPPFYYRIREWSELRSHAGPLPLSFSEGVRPLGFTIPVDAKGDRLKSSLNPSVVFDIERGQPVAYPLRRDE